MRREVASANAQLGFDSGYPIVDIDDFAGEGVEFDLQVIEFEFQVVESSIQASFKVANARLHAAHPGINTIEPGIQTAELDGVHQDSNQDGKGRNTDGKIKLQVRHLQDYCTSAS
jgi:hypothetical protein